MPHLFFARSSLRVRVIIINEGKITKMNRKINLKQVYFAVLIAVSIVASALRTLALFLDFDMKSGHFNGKALIGAGDIVVGVGCIFLFTYVFIGGKKEKLIASFTTPHTYVPAGTITVALLFFAFRAYEKLRLMGFSIREKPTAATLPEFSVHPRNS